MTRSSDRYGDDVLASDWKRPKNGRTTDVEAELDMVLEDPSNDFVGAVVRMEAAALILEDRFGRQRSYPYGPGFWLDGKPVAVRRPSARPGRQGPRRTASGSIAVDDAPARVARASRIYVEGRHDAELVEKVWGDDLRAEGIVVEPLHGADDLQAAVAEFQPNEHRRLGVLLDHLVPGSKETRIAEETMRMPGAAGNVLILGHPYVDVWQAVKPQRLGLQQWPHIPRGTDIKVGTLAALGWPHSDQRDIAHGWKKILAQVRSYADLEPSLLGRVEELIDFITAPSH